MKKLKELFFIGLYLLAALSPLYLKHFIGQTYYTGMFIGVISILGFSRLDDSSSKERKSTLLKSEKVLNFLKLSFIGFILLANTFSQPIFGLIACLAAFFGLLTMLFIWWTGKKSNSTHGVN